MSDREDDQGVRPPPGRTARIVSTIGGIALLGAMTTDFLGVIGRHTGLSLLGSIEIVQALVLVSGSIAILIATAERSHAAVHLLMDRLSPRGRFRFGQVNALISALFFAVISAGSAWIAADMAGAHEVSDLLGIPLMPLRVLCTVCMALCACLFLRQCAGRAPR